MLTEPALTLTTDHHLASNVTRTAGQTTILGRDHVNSSIRMTAVDNVEESTRKTGHHLARVTNMMRGADRVRVTNTTKGADRVKDNTTNGADRVKKTLILGLRRAKVIQTRDRERDREASRGNHSTSMSGTDLAPVKGTTMSMPATRTTDHIHGRTATTKTTLPVRKLTMMTGKAMKVVVITERKIDSIRTQVLRMHKIEVGSIIITKTPIIKITTIVTMTTTTRINRAGVTMTVTRTQTGTPADTTRNSRRAVSSNNKTRDTRITMTTPKLPISTTTSEVSTPSRGAAPQQTRTTSREVTTVTPGRLHRPMAILATRPLPTDTEGTAPGQAVDRGRSSSPLPYTLAPTAVLLSDTTISLTAMRPLPLSQICISRSKRRSFVLVNSLQMVEPKRLTPHKFCLPHMRASFGAAGLLVKVLPNQPSDGQPALVVIQDLADVIGEGREVDELTAFPGPLIKGETHKNDVLMYCQKKARQCRDDDTQVDRESAELLWKYLQLLIKQNGTVVGADIADLLLEGHEPSSLDYSRHGLRIGRSREDLLDDSSAIATTTGVNRSVIAGGGADLSVDDVTDRFRNLLLHGQKKDALEWAIKHSLWGHALFLASKMDQKTHASVMTRFANVSMKMNDPLQTLYQLMSGRQPAAVTLAMDEKWGDWRPHLAMILSNQSNKPDLDRKSIIILGDTLAAKGCLHASHFCYLMASVALTDCSRRSSKLVLIGSSHSLPFGEFASNTAIQCTEVYEFAQSLGNPLFVAISFQSFKMIYALRLLEAGLAEQALHYCEVIARTLLQNPQFYTSTLVALVYQFADRLKLFDPLRLQMGDDAVEDPDWLVNLHRLHQAFQDGSMQTISGAQTPVMGIRTGSTATNSEVGDIMLYGHQHMTSAHSDSIQTYGAVSQGGAVVPQSGAGTDVVAGQDYSQYLPQQQPQPGWDPSQQSDLSQHIQQQQYDPQTQQQHWDPSQQAQQQPQWDPNQQQTLQQWDANSNNQQQQQWDPNQPQTLQQWDSSPQTQQWGQGQLDNGYPGYQPEQGATTDATDAQSGPVTTSPDNRLQGDSGHTGEVPRALHGVDLGASMNSGITATTSATSEDDESHDSGAPPGFDYFGMTANPLEGDGDSFSDESSSSCSSDNLVTARDVGPVDGVGAAPLRCGPANQFGKSAGSSLPLGASASNFEKPMGAPGKQTYPGEEGEDQTGGGGPRRQTYPGEEDDDHSDGKNFYNNKANKSWFGSFISKFARKNENEMKLPDDKNPAIVWDADRKRWVNTDGTEEDIDKPTAPPPKDSELTGDAPDGFCNSAGPMGGPPPVMGGLALGAGPPPPLNKFSLQRNRGARKQYVDVMAAGNPSKPAVPPLTNMFTNLPKSASMPANMFVPSVTAEKLGRVGEVQGSSDVTTSDSQELAQQNHLQAAATHDAKAPGITHDQGIYHGANLDPIEAPSNHSRRSSVSSVSREVQSYMQPPPEMAQPPPPSSIPMMFNPAQFNQGAAEQPPAPTSAVSQPHGPRYGQRRHYPK